jgi:hypothetical protein
MPIQAIPRGPGSSARAFHGCRTQIARRGSGNPSPGLRCAAVVTDTHQGGNPASWAVAAVNCHQPDDGVQQARR